MIINKNKCVQITFYRQKESKRSLVEVIRGNFKLLYFIIFFRKNVTSIKSTKTHTSKQKQKRQHFYAHKKHLR